MNRFLLRFLTAVVLIAALPRSTQGAVLQESMADESEVESDLTVEGGFGDRVSALFNLGYRF